MPLSPSPTVLAGLVDALRPHAPFDAMAAADVERIVRASTLRYFAAGETILAPGGSRPAECFVIRQGTVRGERPSAEAAIALWELAEGEMFPLGALLGRRGVTSVYRAAGDTFCLAFPAEVFDAIVASSLPFEDFCTRRLAHLLDLARQRLQAEYASSLTEQRGVATSLAALRRGPAVVVPPDTRIADALALMEARSIGSLPIVDDAGRAIGIFTRQDVIGRIVLPARSLDAPIVSVASAPVHALPADATAGDAAVLMAREGIRHVVVVDEQRRVDGVVSERDLFGLQRLSVRELSSSIRRARDVDAIAHRAADVRALSHALVAQGIAAGPLTRMIASLNDRLVARTIELVAPSHALDGIALCWLGMGSEGRAEQTIATDQDNGLIFDAAGRPDDTIRERLLPFARDVNDALDAVGFPRCRGGVMAMNPRWCLSLAGWTEAFAHWIDRGDPDSLLAAAIFFDFRPLWGDERLSRALRDDIALRAQRNPRFLKQMSDNALANRPPLNWLGDIALRARDDGGFDLKLHGAVPFVDGARILALSCGVTATNTVERFEQAGRAKGIAEAETRAWCDAFEYVQLLRLRAQHRRSAGAEAHVAANVVPLDALSDLDRRILREAMRQARKLQQRLELDYPG